MQRSLLAEPPAAPLELRYYQRDCVQAVYAALREHSGNPVCVIPTGGGKSPCIAQIASDTVERWLGRALVVTHVKELIEQLYGSLKRARPKLDIGIYSAGLGRREKRTPIVVAGIQSIYQRALELGRFEVVIVDEAQLVPPDGEGMYRTLLAELLVANPDTRLIGFTATPFRTKTGPICTTDGLFNHICYEIGIAELMAGGFLTRLRGKAGQTRFDTSGLAIRGGEFAADEMEALFDVPELVRSAVDEIVAYTHDRQSVLLFCSGEQHGRDVQVACAARGLRCEFVSAQTADDDRRRWITEFREGQLKYLANINVLTIGFDAPNTDCIALLRATQSPGLYYQMVGRGFRIAEGKPDCVVLDFGGNILRHGPVDRLTMPDDRRGIAGEAPAKECPQCHSLITAGYGVCPDCGYRFPEPERTAHEATASSEGVLSGEETITEYDVTDVYYSVHTKRHAPEGAPQTMRVDYMIALGDAKSEWICFEHDGYARQKAERWWLERSHDPVPLSAEEAVYAANSGALANTLRIRVRKVAGESFERIIGYELAEKPSMADARLDSDDLSDVPF